MSLPKYPRQIAHHLWHNIWYEFGLTHYAEHFLSPILVLIFEIAAGNFSVILLVSVATHMVRISIVKKRWLRGLVYWLVGWWPVRGPLHWLTAVVPLVCRHWLPAILLIYGHWSSRCIIHILQRTLILLPWRSRPFRHSLGSAMLVIHRCPLAIPLVDQWHSLVSLADPAVSPAQEYENRYPCCYPYLNLSQVFYVVSWAGISLSQFPVLPYLCAIGGPPIHQRNPIARVSWDQWNLVCATLNIFCWEDHLVSQFRGCAFLGSFAEGIAGSHLAGFFEQCQSLR